MSEFPKLDLLPTEEDVAALRAEIDELLWAAETARDRLEQLLGKGYGTDDLILLGQLDEAIAKHKGEA